MIRKSLYLKIVFVVLLVSFLSVFSVGCGGKGVFFVGHKGTKVLHRPGCDYAPPKDVSVSFMSTSKAQSKGYSPCRVCDPLNKTSK